MITIELDHRSKLIVAHATTVWEIDTKFVAVGTITKRDRAAGGAAHPTIGIARYHEEWRPRLLRLFDFSARPVQTFIGCSAACSAWLGVLFKEHWIVRRAAGVHGFDFEAYSLPGKHAPKSRKRIAPVFVERADIHKALAVA